MGFYEKLEDVIVLQYGSIYNFCQSANMSHSTFSRIKKNGIEACSQKFLAKISRHLFLDFDELKKGNVVELDPDSMNIAKVAPPPPPIKSDVVDIDILRRLQKLNVPGKLKVIEYIEDISYKYGLEE